MSWQQHIPGANTKLDEMVARRFGPDFSKPCKRPGVIECALSLCQWNNECAYIPTDNEKYEAAAKAQLQRKVK